MPAPVAPVDWNRIERDIDEILAPRPVKGDIKNRGEAETGQQLWDLSLRQELAHEGSESDKLRARKYIHDVAIKAKQVDLPRCTLRLRFARVKCDNGD